MDDCEKSVYARGWCHTHYTRWRKHGDVTVDLRRLNRRGESERFWSKVDQKAECWTWTAGLSPSGYGKFWTDAGRTVRSHRWAYEQSVGPIPSDLQLDHLCRNRACVRPEHLEAVTPLVNTMRSKGLASANAAKTHCPRGHAYDETNTYAIPVSKRQPNGGRGCMACRRLAYRLWYAKAGRKRA